MASDGGGIEFESGAVIHVSSLVYRNMSWMISSLFIVEDFVIVHLSSSESMNGCRMLAIAEAVGTCENCIL